MRRILKLCLAVVATAAAAHAEPEKKTLAEMAEMSEAELRKYDIAYINLMCAEGLKGAESIDSVASLRKLDQWAEWLAQETAKNLYRYRAEPAKFRYSEAYFKAALMVTVVAQDFKCRYNPDRGFDPQNPERSDTFFADSRDLFIHGFLDRKATGTCASFPVLYAAHGRKLGYPIKLVSTKGHLFCRWDSPKEKFNIEGTNSGMSTHLDEHYRIWPYKIDDEFISANGHLSSWSAKAELAGFLNTRAACLLANGRRDEAKTAAELSLKLMPSISYYQRYLVQFQQAPTNKDRE